MRIALVIGGALLGCLAAIGVVFVVGMRRKVRLVLDPIRHMGRAMKPIVLRRAGHAGSPTAVVEHVGRRSGSHYETPVVAVPCRDGFAIVLPYGRNTDWLRNVLAAGRATIRLGGDRHDVIRPEVVSIDVVDDAFATKDRRMHRAFGIRDALLVHVAGVDIDGRADRSAAASVH